MTTEVQEVKTDPKTGLPEAPEGMFWRVGEKKRNHERFSYTRESYGEGVFLMSITRTGTPTKVPVMGQRWWNKTIVVGEVDGPIKYTETVSEIEFHRFSGFYSKTKEDIPSFVEEDDIHPFYPSYYSGSSERQQDGFTYSVPMSAEGIAHTANHILKRHNERLEYTRKQKEKEQVEKEAKSKYYGDYPPKSLVDL